MIEHKNWQYQAIALHNTGTMSGRDIAKMIGVPKSTVNDYLRKYLSFKNEVELEIDDEGTTHLVIFDTQVRPGITLDYLEWIGKAIVKARPDVIILIGDHADMPSLSSYDRGKRTAEGRRVQEDIQAAIQGMCSLLLPLYTLQQAQLLAGEKVYNPRRVITIGNHEDRITRHVDANPELHGFLSIDDLKYEQFGWEVIPFLTPINIDEVNYCHYFPNVMTGKPIGGTAANMLKILGESFTMGHRQILDVANRTLQSSGQKQWGVICGASYVHDEAYKGNQGNKHWRGIMICRNVKDGSYDPEFISMEALEKEHGE